MQTLTKMCWCFFRILCYFLNYKILNFNHSWSICANWFNLPDEGGGIFRLSMLLSLSRDWLGGGGQVTGVSMATTPFGRFIHRTVRLMTLDSASRVSTYIMSRSDTTLLFSTTISSPTLRPANIFRIIVMFHCNGNFFFLFEIFSVRLTGSFLRIKIGK